MNEMISKAILSGLGFASLTRDAIRQTARDLVKQSKLSENEGRKVVEDFQRRSMEAQKTFEKKVHTAVRNALKHLDVQPAGARAKKTAKAGAKRTAKGRRKTTRSTKAQ